MPPVGIFAIDTSTFSNPGQFFSSLQTYVSSNYYSDHTIFATGLPGPALVTDDDQYLYGNCITASYWAGTCKSVNGFMVRKIARKGALFWACAKPLGASACGNFASIDTTIAQEQFAELGPVIVQQVAAFLQFYAPALSVNIQGSGSGAVTSSPGTGINCDSGTCSALFVQGAQVTLTATQAGFTGWSGDCASAGTTLTAQVTLTEDMDCTATFGELKPAVHLNPFGSQTLTTAPGPYYVEAVDSNLNPISPMADITVTIHRDVNSGCHAGGPLFSSDSTVVISQGQTSSTYGSVAGRDPNCNTVAIQTVFTIKSATIGPNNTPLDLSGVPSAQLSLSVLR